MVRRRLSSPDVLVPTGHEEIWRALLKNLFEQPLESQTTHVARRGKRQCALRQHVPARCTNFHDVALVINCRVLVTFSLSNHGGRKVPLAVDARGEETPRTRFELVLAKQSPHFDHLDVISATVLFNQLVDRVIVETVVGHKESIFVSSRPFPQQALVNRVVVPVVRVGLFLWNRIVQPSNWQKSSLHCAEQILPRGNMAIRVTLDRSTRPHTNGRS
mmetsp:Transcript_47008/g.92530  ORF Transcript_47008/g.92530 Transcript_47008/m.92530 type:complete len:217 (+) Transcript_47008:63-713(+)